MLVRVRRLIETVIGQLARRFHFEKIWARNMWHLMSRITAIFDQTHHEKAISKAQSRDHNVRTNQEHFHQ